MSKISKKAFYTANQRGIFKEFQFYLCIKSINTPGYLPKGSFLNIIQSRIKDYNSHNPFKKLPTSHSQISKLINRLNELGFCRRNKTGIYLTSYKKVFALLEASDRYYKLDQNTFLEDFYFKVLKKKIRNIKHCIKKTDPYVRAGGQLEIFFSCQSIANLFGFKSKSQGYKIRTYLESKKLIEVRSNDYKLLGSHIMNKHHPASFKIKNNYFYKPSCTISIIM